MRSYKIIPFSFPFKRPGGTSRGVMTIKKSWFVVLKQGEAKAGIGECSIIERLSPDFYNDSSYLASITHFCEQWKSNTLSQVELRKHPSIQFGIETALKDLETGSAQLLFDTPFTQSQEGIKINGLVWMGSPEFMREQINEKLNSGYTCIKMKIGAIDWKTEHQILSDLRKEYKSSEIELRVDANGAFSFEEAPQILNQLAELEIHSIEQPIKPNQLDEMAELCSTTPCPIALDEELIGKIGKEEKIALLQHIKPQYIILKPSLIGGFSGMNEWIDSAKGFSIPWWATSALESNIGLNAIAQFTARFNNPLPQGLGTGSLYTVNIPSPLFIDNGNLFYDGSKKFDLGLLEL